MKEAAQITNNNIGSNSQPATAPELEDIKQFLSARISNPPTLEETANRLGVSGRTLRRRFCDSSAFSKAFKKWAGLSPREFKKKHLN